jgi:heptosyltransferase I
VPLPEIPARRICLIRTSALGDVIHALALVNGLRHGYPDAQLTWIVHPVPYEAVREQPNVDRFIVFPRTGVRSWRRLARELRAERFDLVLVPQVSFKASMIAALVRSGVKVGFDFRRSRELHWLFTNRHIPHCEPQHVQDQYLEFLDYLGVAGYRVEWNIVFTAEERRWRDEFFSHFSGPVAAFVVASAHPEKDWIPERYARVMEHAAARLGLCPLIVGGPSAREREVAAAIVRLSRCEVGVALETPVRHTLLQLSGSAVVVAPDTGPLHAAVAMNVPTVGLYGYSNPRRCGPYRRFGDLLVDRFSAPGEDDARRRTRPGRMAAITVDDVTAKLELAAARYLGGDRRREARTDGRLEESR